MSAETASTERQGKPAECDVLVIGSGAAGLSTAITARKHGLQVIVIEKEEVFGGTTAFSGGCLWVPRSPVVSRLGIEDSREAARLYVQHEAGEFFDAAQVDAFLDACPDMVDFFERETEAKFALCPYPDYHPEVPGAVDVGRTIIALAYDIRGLGANMRRLRRPLQVMTFAGMMFSNLNQDIKHFFRITKSFESLGYVVRRIGRHLIELARYGRGVQVTSGNALVARLAKTCFDLGIPICTSSPARHLLIEGGAVTGAKVWSNGTVVDFRARRGVVLACGGFSHDLARTRLAYEHVRGGAEAFSPVIEGNSGDGARLAESAGGVVDVRLANGGAWVPISKVPLGDGRYAAFPHLLDRAKPGMIGVNAKGERIVNESDSYHDVCIAMTRDGAGRGEASMWLMCNHATIRKFGLGYVRPAPYPLGAYLRSGYLLKGNTLAELAAKAKIDPAGLERTVREFDASAANGEDPKFGRGRTTFNRFLGDPSNLPNPCVAPVGAGPYYAVKMIVGDLGSFDGIRADAMGRVLTAGNEIVPGLYTVGNDRASIFGGSYLGAGITLGTMMTFGYLTGRHLAGIESGAGGGNRESLDTTAVSSSRPSPATSGRDADAA